MSATKSSDGENKQIIRTTNFEFPFITGDIEVDGLSVSDMWVIADFYKNLQGIEKTVHHQISKAKDQHKEGIMSSHQSGAWIEIMLILVSKMEDLMDELELFVHSLRYDE